MKECLTGSDQSPPFKDELILLFKVTVHMQVPNINMQKHLSNYSCLILLAFRCMFGEKMNSILPS